MNENVTASLSFDEASKMERERTLLGWLEWRGIDTRRMTARREASRIVYEGAPLTAVNSGHASSASPNACSVSEDGSSATTMSQGSELAPAASAGGNGDGGLTGDNPEEETR